MDTDQIERILLDTGVLQTGHFLLTSGRHSDKYMQCAKLQQYPAHIENLTAEVAGAFEEAELVVAPAVGAIVNGYELARQLGARFAFAERENGKLAFRRGFDIPKGAKTVVVEDTVTTGGTVRELIDLVATHGGRVVGVAAIIDRSNGAVRFGVPFYAAYTADVTSYTEAECPLCKEGGLPLVSHGSRRLVY